MNIFSWHLGVLRFYGRKTKLKFAIRAAGNTASKIYVITFENFNSTAHDFGVKINTDSMIGFDFDFYCDSFEFTFLI